MKHDFENGKYTVEFVGGELRALRYGEPWRDFTGDKLMYLMLAEIDELRAQNGSTPPVQDDEVLEVLRELVNAREAFGAACSALERQQAAYRIATADTYARSLLAKRGAA